MNQGHHEAGDPHVGLAAPMAEQALSILEGYNADGDEGNESIAEICGKLADIDGDGQANLTAEQASVAAKFIRAQGGDHNEHTAVLKALDAVAVQHGGSPGNTSAGESGAADHEAG